MKSADSKFGQRAFAEFVRDAVARGLSRQEAAEEIGISYQLLALRVRELVQVAERLGGVQLAEQFRFVDKRGRPRVDRSSDLQFLEELKEISGPVSIADPSISSAETEKNVSSQTVDHSSSSNEDVALKTSLQELVDIFGKQKILRCLLQDELAA